MAIIERLNQLLQDPLIDTIASVIKKFKSSKSFYGIFYLLALFTTQQAISWKYGTAISSAINNLGEAWYYGFIASILENGSIELVVLGVVLIVILSWVEVSKNQNNQEGNTTQGNPMQVNGDNNGIINSGNNNKITQTTNNTTINSDKNSAKAIVGLVIIVVVIVLFIPKGNSTVINESMNNATNSTFNVITGDNNTINNGINDKTLQMIYKSHEREVNDLKARLEKALSSQEQQKLSVALQKAQQELATKTQELQNTQKTLNSIKDKEIVLKEAQRILSTQGTTQAIDYLRSIKAKNRQKRIDEDMKSLAKEFQLQAQLLIVENRYDEAKKAYQEMIKYDRSVESLGNYALFLQNQNQFKEAIEGYEALLKVEMSQAHRATILNNLAILYRAQNQNKQALQAYQEAEALYRELAKANPSVYNPDVAMTLNNLAILYSDQNQNQQALQAYQEALSLRRELAKANPKVYELYYAKMLILGVDDYQQDKKDLQIAKKIITQERYQDVYFAKSLLKWIEKIEKQ